jgi:hypothetical protein
MLKNKLPRLAIITSIAIAGALSGCGDKDRNPDPPPKPVGQNNFAGDLVATKDRVRNDVNQAMDENQKKLDEAMQKQAGDENSDATNP